MSDNQVIGTIKNKDTTILKQAVLDFLENSFGNKIHQAQSSSLDDKVQFIIQADNYQDAKTILGQLISEYDTDLEWRFIFDTRV